MPSQTSPQQSDLSEIARRVGEAVAVAVLKELQSGDGHGKQITVHIPPRGAATVRVQLPPRVLEIGGRTP